MEELWPAPSAEAAEVIRSVSQHLLAEAEGFAAEVTPPALTAQHDPALLADGSLAKEDRHISRSDLVLWLTANVQRPGRRVELHFNPRTTAYIQDLTSRGIAPDFVEGWRVALAIAWRRWLRECLAQCADPSLLEEILDATAQSMAQYAIDWVVAAREASVADAMANADSDAVATIQLIASGTSIPQDFAEGRLNYKLARWHQALVLWTEDPAQVEALEAAVAAIQGTTAGRRALVARASTTSRWIWLSGPVGPDQDPVEKALTKTEVVQSTVGRCGHGLEGFRASHQDALAAQTMIIRLGSGRRFTAYADVELIDTLTRDRATARRLVINTLGPLAAADEVMREALLTYIQCRFNTTRTAATLYAHRNTVERRVSRANELSVIKVEDNPTQVAAALLVLEVAPDIAAAAY